MNHTDQIRQQAYDIEMRSLDTEILLNTITEKLDVLGCASEESVSHVNAIYCFVTCTLRNVQLLREHNQHILALTARDPQDVVTPLPQDSKTSAKGKRIVASEKVGA